MMLSNVLWAKKTRAPVIGREVWLPLRSHMSDAAEIARKIWENWLPPGTKKTIASGILSPDEGCENLAGRIFVFLAAAHDLGKASPVFQSKGSPITAQLDELINENIRDAGFPLKNNREYSERSGSHHSIVSHLILERHGFDESVSVVVGAHHGKPPSWGQLENISAYVSNCGFDNKLWIQAQDELLDYALDLSELRKADTVGLKLNKATQVLLSALVILADWISSDEEKFPLFDIESCQSAEHSPEQADSAWEALNLTPFWNVQQDWDDLYGRRFDITPRPLQEKLLEVVKNCAAPGIVVVEAQTGEGKTEAALAAAEVMAELSGRGGLLFALPTQATSDAMFGRILKWIEHFDTDYNTHSVRLAHGKADFNKTYSKIELSDNTHVGDDEGVIVHKWLSQPKKSLLADFVIGTIDQLLMAGLKQKHVMLRHLGLANKVVIIDECHAYDTYMAGYLFKVLSWLGAYGTPVIVLSATLPSERRKQVIDAYLNHVEDPYDPLYDGREPEISQWAASREYPLITCTDRGEVKLYPVAGERRRLDVSIRKLCDDEIMNTLDGLLSGGGCAGVVVNTVKRAQELYGDIAKHFGKECVRLLHSRFISPDRAEKEDELLSMLGPPDKAQRPNKLIVVGTQVLEQSLDLDFDLLITDLSPMDLLIQRIGRLHRHKRNRPEKLRSAVCYVLGASDEKFEGGSQKIYGKYLLMRTKALLPAEITMPDSIPGLVQDVYDDKKEIPIDPAHWEEYESAQKEEENRNKNQESRSKNFQFSGPEGDTFVDCLNIDVSDRKGEATVRDGADSLEVIAVQKIDGAMRLLPWIGSGRKIPHDHTPDNDLARILAGCRVRLPSELDAEWRIGKTIECLEKVSIDEHLDEWQKSRWLKEELFLVLDEACKAELCGYLLEYDQYIGLTHRKLEG